MSLWLFGKKIYLITCEEQPKTISARALLDCIQDKEGNQNRKRASLLKCVLMGRSYLYHVFICTTYYHIALNLACFDILMKSHSGFLFLGYHSATDYLIENEIHVDRPLVKKTMKMSKLTLFRVGNTRFCVRILSRDMCRTDSDAGIKYKIFRRSSTFHLLFKASAF